jgi:hypothetical protein
VTAARTRVIEMRHERCLEPHHRPGNRVWLWELLVDPRQTSEFDGHDRRTREAVV